MPSVMSRLGITTPKLPVDSNLKMTEEYECNAIRVRVAVLQSDDTLLVFLRKTTNKRTVVHSPHCSSRGMQKPRSNRRDFHSQSNYNKYKTKLMLNTCWNRVASNKTRTCRPPPSKRTSVSNRAGRRIILFAGRTGMWDWVTSPTAGSSNLMTAGTNISLLAASATLTVVWVSPGQKWTIRVGTLMPAKAAIHSATTIGSTTNVSYTKLKKKLTNHLH